MKSRIECFLIVPTLRAKVSLRRYVSSEEARCPKPSGYHDASTPIGERALDPANEEYFALLDTSEPPHSDPRWPTACECGYQFAEKERWQLFYDVVYVRQDTGAEMTLRTATPGALWDCSWWPNKGADGHHWCVKLPPGGASDEWQIDGPSKGGGRWTRTGIAPKLTVTPSILTPRYHGFLRNGVLEEC